MTDYELLDVSWDADDDGQGRVTVVDMRHQADGQTTIVLDLPLSEAIALGIDLIAAAREAYMGGAS